jgi:phage/plasmid-associated DNA primase
MNDSGTNTRSLTEDKTKWFYKLDDMYEYADKNSYTFYVCADRPKGDGSKEYCCFKNGTVFNDYYMRVPDECKNLYEIQREGRPRYEAYDLEIEVKNLKPDQKLPSPEELYNHFINECYPSDDEEMYFNKRDEKPEWLVLDSSNKDKTSLHLKNAKRVFRNEKDNKQWVNQYVKDSNIYHNVPDKSIYNRNQPFRLVDSTKIKKNRYLKIWTKHNANVSKRKCDYFITDVKEEDKINRVEDGNTEHKVLDEEKDEINENGESLVYLEMGQESKQSKLKELCSYIIHGIKTDAIKELHERGGKGVICYRDCMTICCAIINEGMLNDVEYDTFVEEIMKLYRNKSDINLKQQKEKWEDSVAKRIKHKEKTSTVNTLYYYALKAGWKPFSKSNYNLIVRQDEGCADIVASAIKDKYKILDGDACIYYDEKMKVWTVGDEHDIKMKISEVLEPMLDTLIKSEKQKMDSGDNKTAEARIKVLKSIRSYVLKTSGKTNIYKALIPKIRDINAHQDIIKYQNKHIYVFGNGTCYDYIENRLRDLTYDDYATNPSTINYFECKEIDSQYKYACDYFSLIFEEDKEVINYVKRVCGYLMTKEVKEQKMIIARGCGMNSKDVFFNMLHEVQGDNFQKGSTKLVLECDDGSANSHTAQLQCRIGSNVVFISEPKKTLKLCTSAIKDYTGSEEFIFRAPHSKRTLRYPATDKLVMACNLIPEPDEIGSAVKRRFLIIGFYITFDPQFKGRPNYREGKDGIGAEITKNICGFQKWLIEGAVEYYKYGLKDVPEKFLNEKEEYVDTVDYFKDFLSAYEKTEVPNEMMKAATLLDKLKTFISEQNIRSNKSEFNFMNKAELKQKMVEYGYTHYKKKDTNYYNIKLKQTNEDGHSSEEECSRLLHFR